ncbi:LysE family transporter [Frigidibacter albus]|uniref:LysE family transporter n=1 Tax=Frigidibacter albus TaxID=1465486 RepID=A0A6L8VKG4_9RHOB|nr:LysE family translocator [Frigidibacter albus]MZQ90281.1 LysE family transporter [Frigidibacter albus]NBE32221.1 LysE family transporter [Frigidibacter albus]GGH58535.1 threonine transporter RhtB [Frigidibacter albus]
MTLSGDGLLLYAGALAILWVTPGPVFVALSARALSGGFRSAWPLAVGVTLGDILWPLVAIFGLSWIADQQAALMDALRWVAAAIFILMGAGLIAHAARPLTTDGRMTRPGLWAGFSAGVAAILGNPKAILFYMGVLPGFFDLTRVGTADIAVILALSAAIPLAGNLAIAAAISRARQLLSSPGALVLTNKIAGALLIVVGLAIALL